MQLGEKLPIGRIIDVSEQRGEELLSNKYQIVEKLEVVEPFIEKEFDLTPPLKANLSKKKNA